MKRSYRERAIDLRRRGWSYNIISQRLGVSKSTLSGWLRTVPYEPNRAVIERIRAGPAKAAVSKRRVVIGQINSFKKSGRKEIGSISRRDLWFLGIGLYMGEGSKLYEELRFINSDPEIVKLGVAWFRKVCRVPNRNFRVGIHLYPDTSQSAAVRYWSRVTGIPKSQFEKIQVDYRLDKSLRKKRSLPYGTAHLKIRALGNPRFGVALHRRIMGWFEAVYQKVRA